VGALRARAVDTLGNLRAKSLNTVLAQRIHANAAVTAKPHHVWPTAMSYKEEEEADRLAAEEREKHVTLSDIFAYSKIHCLREFSLLFRPGSQEALLRRDTAFRPYNTAERNESIRMQGIYTQKETLCTTASTNPNKQNYRDQGVVNTLKRLTCTIAARHAITEEASATVNMETRRQAMRKVWDMKNSR